MLGFYTPVGESTRASHQELPYAVGVWVTLGLEQKILVRDNVRLVGIHWRPLRASLGNVPMLPRDLDQIYVTGIDAIIMAACGPFNGREWRPNLVWTAGRLSAQRTESPDVWAPGNETPGRSNDLTAAAERGPVPDM